MKAVWLAFGAIFIAELGDKTQLAILAMTGRGYSAWAVFIGSMLAFAVLTGIAVLIGDWVQTRIPAETISKIAGASFVTIGVLMWFGKI
ncbi:MAG: TMEM165/GDT1 family protein [Candidatus Marinimicrobia bacterium]|nr:TMEM165/GDT1 family protein [Candidatus Neomarinimicrobiota bacterium]